MKASLRAAWAAALRSGKYRKTTGAFIVGPNSKAYPETANQPEAFCCLGVLCKVAGVPIEVDDCGGNWTFVGDTLGTLHNDLYVMNDAEDGKRYPFPAIADWIEANIPITVDNIKDTL